jgi:hypothetical protein
MAARQAGSAGEPAVEGYFVTVAQRPNQQHLAVAVPPGLADGHSRDVNGLAGVGGQTQQGASGSVVAIEGDQRPGIED